MIKIFSEKEYYNILNLEALKIFEKICIGIKNIDIIYFFNCFLNRIFDDPIKALENKTFKDLLKDLKLYGYIKREDIFNKKISIINIKEDEVKEDEVKNNINYYINYCRSLHFEDIFENPVIYFITDGEYVKIGQSINPKNRLLSLRTANPRKLTLLTILKDIPEPKTRSLFKDKHIHGEWFKFDTETIIRIEYLKKQNKINMLYTKKLFKLLKKNIKTYG